MPRRGAATFTHSANLALDGAVVAVLFACSGITQRISFKRSPVACERLGLLALTAGLGLLAAAGVAGSIWLLLAASVAAVVLSIVFILRPPSLPVVRRSVAGHPEPMPTHDPTRHQRSQEARPR